MAVFSTNQVRQFYVANAKQSSLEDVKTLGDICLGQDAASKDLYFNHLGQGGITRSDLISPDKIVSATVVAPTKRPLKQVQVKLDDSVGIVSGQDYILRINFRQFAGGSDEDMYFKYGAVHAYKNMEETDFYTALAASLWLNFSREIEKLVDIKVGGSIVARVAHESGKPVLYDEANAKITATTDGVTIVEHEQDWVPEIGSKLPVYFDVVSDTILLDGDEVVWGAITDVTDDTLTVGNGTTIADMEFFYMGERADIYRKAGYPNYVPTKYMVDPSADYYCLDIHYYYSGEGDNNGKSEKTITIVSTTSSVLTDLLTEINTKAGTEFTVPTFD